MASPNIGPGVGVRVGMIVPPGVVGIPDYNRWFCEYMGNGTCRSATGTVISTLSSDFNRDNKVDIGDFQIWLNHVP